MGCALLRPWSLLATLVFLLHTSAGAQSMPWLSSFQIAFARLKQGDLPQALAEFDSLWRSYPRDVQLATSIGGVLDATAHHDRATVWYQRALAIQPDFPPALEDLAMNCAIRSKLGEAAGLLRRSLQQNPDNGKAAYNLGLILLRLQRYGEASAVLKSAETAADHPPLEQIYIAEATAAFHLTRYPEAIAVLRKCGKPGTVAAFQLLGSAQALSGDLPGAIKTFQEAITAYPDNPDLYFRLAMVFAEGRRDSDAEAVLRRASEQIPNSPVIDYGRAVLDEMTGRDEEAISWAKTSIGAMEKQPEVWGLLGTLYEHIGDTEAALQAYRKALDHGGNESYTGTKYAELLIRLQRYSDAANELKKLDSSYPNDPLVNRAFGKLYRAEGQNEKAETYLRRSIGLDGTDPQAHYALAQILHHQGRTKEENEQLKAFKNSKEKAETIRLLELVGNP